MTMIRVEKVFSLLLSVAAIHMSASLPAESAPQRDAGYTITISPTQTPFRIGFPMIVKATVTVTAKSPIPWETAKRNTEYRAFHFILTSAHGESQKTSFHKGLRGEQIPENALDLGASTILLQLQPGSVMTITFDLAKLYKIEEVGTYSLQVDRTTENQPTQVRSNVVQLQVQAQ